MRPGIQAFYSGRLQILKFNNPKKKNAITLQMYRDINKHLEDGSRKEDVVATVFTGEGDYYTSGNDFTDQELSSSDVQESQVKALKAVRDFVASLIDYPKLLIAVVNGPAIGIGASTLSLFDFVYAHKQATFHTPFTALGLHAEGCSSYLFPKLMGKSVSSRMLYGSEKIGTKEGLECGLVTQAYHSSEVELIWAKINQIASYPKGALLANKRLMRLLEKDVLHKVNNAEMDSLEERFKSDEFLEAFVQKFMKKSRSKL